MSVFPHRILPNPLLKYAATSASSGHQSQTKNLSQLALQNIRKMSTRRSTRLSAATAIAEQADIPAPPAQQQAAPKKANISKKRKAVEKENILPTGTEIDDGPTTPRRKRVTRDAPPPITPTPTMVKIMSSPYQHGNMSPPPPPRNRLAVPQGTNAALVTPETHRLVATKPVDEVSPTKKVGVSTTGSILDEALAHLVKVEPKLQPIINKHHCNIFSPEGLAEEIDPFNSLTSGIISQQVSGAAAKSIKQKFVALFNTSEEDTTLHTFPTPSQVVASTIPTLRTAGLSQRKAEYVYGLAEKFHSGEITTEFLFSATYEEVFEKLIAVRGLGRWSVEMFACFGLKRLDVFSTGDLGVARGMAALAGRDVAKLKNGKGKWKYMAEKDMESTAEKFRPYRSVYMWYTWRAADTDISSFDD